MDNGNRRYIAAVEFEWGGREGVARTSSLSKKMFVTNNLHAVVMNCLCVGMHLRRIFGQENTSLVSTRSFATNR